MTRGPLWRPYGEQHAFRSRQVLRKEETFNHGCRKGRFLTFRSCLTEADVATCMQRPRQRRRTAPIYWDVPRRDRSVSSFIDSRNASVRPISGCALNHQRCCMPRSVPRAKQSMRFSPQLTQFGSSRMVPPRLSQPPHCARTSCG